MVNGTPITLEGDERGKQIQECLLQGIMPDQVHKNGTI